MEPKNKNFGDLLKEGLADAIGFVLGALLGWAVGRLLGFDFSASTDYDGTKIIGLGFILVGGTLGRIAARKLLKIDKA